jgi:hypothetical protein
LPFKEEDIEGTINENIANRTPFRDVTCYIPALIGFLGLEQAGGGQKIPLTCHEAAQLMRCDR